MSRLPPKPMLAGTGETISPHVVRQISYTIPNTAGSATSMTTDANGNIVVTVTSPLLASTRVDHTLPDISSCSISPPPSASDTTNRTLHDNTKITNRSNVSRGLKRNNSHLEVSPMPVKRMIVEPPVNRETIDLVSPVSPSGSCTSASYASASASTPRPKPEPEPTPIVIPTTTHTSSPSSPHLRPKPKPTPIIIPTTTTHTRPPSPLSGPKPKPTPAPTPITIPTTTHTIPPSLSPHLRPKPKSTPIFIPTTTHTRPPSSLSRPKPKPKPTPIFIPTTTHTRPPSPLSRPKPKPKPTPVTIPTTTHTSPPSHSLHLRPKPKPTPISIPTTTHTSPPSLLSRPNPNPNPNPTPTPMPITIPTTTTHTKPPSPSPPHTRPKIPPPINGMDKHTMFEFVDSVSLTVWSSHMHKPYFWAMIGDDAATNSNEPTHFRIEFVLDTLRSVVGNDTEFVAIPASTQVPKTVSFKAPHPILVTCDSEEVVTRLVERRYIDTPDGWLCIFPKNLHPSSFIMYLRAPVVEDSPTHKAQIIESVQTRLRTIPDFRVFVENNCTDPLLLKITSKEVRFEYIVNSVRASAIQVVSNGFPMVLWRIYMHPVTCDVKKHWGVLVKELRMLKYPGPMWIAEAITDTTVFRCNRCKALDHPAGLCPVWEYEGSWCRAQTRSGRKL